VSLQNKAELNEQISTIKPRLSALLGLGWQCRPARGSIAQHWSSIGEQSHGKDRDLTQM
jgi:hypothetical protein